MFKQYLKKFKPLINWYRKFKGLEKGGEHWCRIVMDQETQKLINSLPVSNLDVFEISGKKWKDKGFKSYSTLDFPEYDVCKNILKEQYDLIIAEQVFEHVTHPYRAGINVFNSLKSGGYFLITTPFLIKIHNYPIDCSRWSELGLKYFLYECGFDFNSIQSGSWGNKSALVSNLSHWVSFKPKRHSLVNDPEFPLVVWALAKKL